MNTKRHSRASRNLAKPGCPQFFLYQTALKERFLERGVFGLCVSLSWQWLEENLKGRSPGVTLHLRAKLPGHKLVVSQTVQLALGLIP